MKQIVQSYRTGELKLAEVPVPALEPGHILVQTAFSAVSLGTEGKKVRTARANIIDKARQRPDQVRQVIDVARREGVLNTYRKVMNRLDEPVPLGYSAAGTVIAVGADVEEFRLGDWVACGGEGAAHAEVIAVPVNLCVKVPDGVALEEAAFTILGAIALQGVRQAEVVLGESIVVIGLGLVGQLTVQLLKADGCRALGIDLDAVKVAMAEKMGADRAMVRADPGLESAILALTRGRGADTVIITAGTPSSDPVELAAKLCRDRGRVVSIGHVGLDLPRQVFYDKELRFSMSRSYGPGRYDPIYEEKGIDYPIGYVRWTEKRNMEAFLDLVAADKVNLQGIITHRFKFEQAEQAYELLAGEKHEAKAPLGVIFEYDTSKDDLAPTARRVHTSVCPQSAIRNPQSTIGVGFIGAGSFARKFLIPPLVKHPHAQLIGVATATGISGQHTAEKFGFAYGTGDYHQILGDRDIQVVFIATRHNFHAQLAIEALQAGKAVFVEKPLALNWEELEEVIAAQKETGGHLMVGFNRRFAPLVQEMRDFFQRRVEPMVIQYRVNAGYLEANHWYHDPDQGGGRIIGEGCHFVDLIAYLVGSSIQTVYAVGMDNVGRYHNDNVGITLTFADGSVGNVLYLANGDAALPKERVEVYSQGATAILDDFSQMHLYRQGRRKSLKRRWDKGHRGEVLAFVDAVREGKPLPTPFEACVDSTAATLAVMDSLPVGLPLVCDGTSWRVRGMLSDRQSNRE